MMLPQLACGACVPRPMKLSAASKRMALATSSVNTTMIGPTCYLQDLFTAESARGLGVGRALIEAVCARARALGATRVYWQTHETNSAAMRLYDQVAEKSGFVVYRRAP